MYDKCGDIFPYWNELFKIIRIILFYVNGEFHKKVLYLNFESIL